MFTDKDKKLAERILSLSSIPPRYRRVTIETVDQENDTLLIKIGLEIQKVADDKFIAYEHVYTPSTRWEPEDFDVAELGTFRFLSDAVKHCCIKQMENDIDNALQADAEYEAWATPVTLEEV